jgi:hypothetical protein
MNGYKELSREVIDENTVQTLYKSANKEIIVRSSFINAVDLEDVFFEIVKRKAEQHIKETENTEQDAG